jgi:hypothetical protein
MSEGRVRRRNPNEEWNFGNRKLLITIYSTAKCPRERTTNAQSDLDVPDYTLLNLAHERAIPLPPPGLGTKSRDITDRHLPPNAGR